MSLGRSPLLQYSNQAVVLFRFSFRTKARASVNESTFCFSYPRKSGIETHPSSRYLERGYEEGRGGGGGKRTTGANKVRTIRALPVDAGGRTYAGPDVVAS